MPKIDAVKCLESLGYRKLTKMQAKAFREIVSGKSNVIIVAPTGSGKTEAAVLPIFYSVRAKGDRPISAIYITPLRALNRDIARRIEKIAECFGLTVALRHGDTPYRLRKAIEANPPTVLVTTPETFAYLLINESLAEYLRNVRFIVIDELQEMLDSKRGSLLFTLIFIFQLHFGVRPVLVGLTATLADEALAREILSNLGAGGLVVVRDEESVKQMSIELVIPTCDDLCSSIRGKLPDERLAARISYIVQKMGEHTSLLLFTNTRSTAEHLGSLLGEVVKELGLDYSVGVHHGSLSREHREKVEEEFKRGKLKAVVATSSLELGIDIGSVEFVIQYLSPRQATRLVQRVGRSGHRLGGVSRGAIISTPNVFHYLESAVIARRAVCGELEREKAVPSPLDVLSYAAVLYAVLSKEGYSSSKFFAEITSLPLYKGLDYGLFREVLDYLSYARVVKTEGDLVRPTKKSRLHVYKVSMIPSTREIAVVDLATGKKIGALDEEYVALNLSKDDYLVLGGGFWKVVAYSSEEGRLYVERSVPTDLATIPYWEGESIPVDFKVARELGSVVRRLKLGLAREIEAMYNVEGLDINKIAGAGDDKTITVDYIESLRLIVINVYGGSRVNSLLKDIIVHHLSVSHPYASVKAYSHPYAIFIKVANIDPSNALNAILYVLKNLGRFLSERKLLEVSRKSKTLLWRVYQVAQRFGAISPETGKVSKAVLEALAETVIGAEAFNEVIHKDYDIDSAQILAEEIERNRVKVVGRTFESPKPFHKELIDYIEIPLVSGTIFDLGEYFSRLLSRRIALICLSCGYASSGRVSEFLNMGSFSCPRCGRATLAPVKGAALSAAEEVVKKLRRGEKLSKDEEKMLDELANRAVLLYRYGKNALLALSALGVGSREASRILNAATRGEDLVRAVYESEKRFLAVRDFIENSKRS